MADESSLIGKKLGNYQLIAEFNSGSYGNVYQGKHIIFQEEPIVAIKVLHAHLSSQEAHSQFIQEAQLLKKLRHPYILPIIDAGIHEGIPYIVTAFASGDSLRNRLKKQTDHILPLQEALKILSQVGQALHYAHQNKIVHRDLKPGNILFNKENEALLADFGIAAVLATSGTKQLGRGGTPAYMAPEQFDGIVSTKSDQYALGCLAYEIMTGHKPFNVENVSLEAIWYQHAKADPVPPTQHNPKLPAYIEKGILKAMAKDRADRYDNVSAFLDALIETDEDLQKEDAQKPTSQPSRTIQSKLSSSSTSNKDEFLEDISNEQISSPRPRSSTPHQRRYRFTPAPKPVDSAPDKDELLEDPLVPPRPRSSTPASRRYTQQKSSSSPWEEDELLEDPLVPPRPRSSTPASRRYTQRKSSPGPWEEEVLLEDDDPLASPRPRSSTPAPRRPIQQRSSSSPWEEEVLLEDDEPLASPYPRSSVPAPRSSIPQRLPTPIRVTETQKSSMAIVYFGVGIILIILIIWILTHMIH